MTAVDERPGGPAAADFPPSGLRLPLLVSARRGWFSVVAPASGLDRPLAGAAPWDPSRLPGRNELVLVTTPRPTSDELAQALTAAGRAQASALVVRGLPPEFDRTAGVPVLVADRQVSWAEIETLVQSLLSGARFGARGGTPTAGGLYELAESAALALDGAVVITDAAFRVLAFGCAGTVDALTSETILARRVPKAMRERLGRMPRAMLVELPGADSRWAAPIRVGATIGGCVLCAPGHGAPESVPRMLNEVSAAAAAWFIDEPAGRDDEDAIRAELLRGLLGGSGSLEALTERLGPSQRWRLAALAPHADAPAITSEHETAMARCARMLDPGAATAVLGSTLFAVFPSSPGSGPADFAERLRQRVSAATGGPMVACLGHPCGTGGEIRAELAPLRHATAVLAARTTPATVHLSDLRPHVLISELAGLADEHPGLLDGALDVLRHDDSPRGAEYLNTLRCWFDAGGDATRAAAALRIHRNTFRYRLQRIEALCAVDLDDPVQRFTVELQVRLLVPPLRTNAQMT
ncbi:helix-turn-helix domain-containing protein [Amycolatopsis silviterrae]|uniref:Helix-turn-helix domain-containing protein n=1 Tax=Amycolatopsis silviterrae TaxID=1656914 RepID=A0ABW5H3G9_9PSEU